ncbi:protein let-653-like isoform X2 [Passer montanus]|nr:protein let-653-like isoform X2 [Passer montanus]
MLSMLLWVSCLALCLFPHMGNHLSAAMLLLSSGNGMKIALLAFCVYCMITSEEVSLTWNTSSLSFSFPNLGCSICILLNNLTQPQGERAESGFSPTFRPDNAVFENLEFPLGVKDGIIILLVLLCLLSAACTLCTLCTLCTMLRDREVLRVVQRGLEDEEEEEGRTEPVSTTTARPGMERRGTQNTATSTTTARPGMERRGTQNTATSTTTARPGMERRGTQNTATSTTTARPGMERRGTHSTAADITSTQPGTLGKETRSKATSTTTAQPGTGRKETRSKATSTTTAQPGMERRGAKRAVSASTQTATKPGQPKPAAAAPVQKKKSKSRPIQSVADEEVAGPSHRGEPAPVVITVTVALGGLPAVVSAQGTRRAQGTVSLWQ